MALQALRKYGKEWKKVAAMVKTRTVVQTRTHAQKYFQKIQKLQASGEVDSDDPDGQMRTIMDEDDIDDEDERPKKKMPASAAAKRHKSKAAAHGSPPHLNSSAHPSSSSSSSSSSFDNTPHSNERSDYHMSLANWCAQAPRKQFPAASLAGCGFRNLARDLRCCATGTRTGRPMAARRAAPAQGAATALHACAAP